MCLINLRSRAAFTHSSGDGMAGLAVDTAGLRTSYPGYRSRTPSQLRNRRAGDANRGSRLAPKMHFGCGSRVHLQTSVRRVDLGVVYMRQEKWKLALAQLEAAEKLAPNVPGIRLNIGLLHYRQGQYGEAIPAFESVVRDMPDSAQASARLLGLSDLFELRYAKAAEAHSSRSGSSRTPIFPISMRWQWPRPSPIVRTSACGRRRDSKKLGLTRPQFTY